MATTTPLRAVPHLLHRLYHHHFIDTTHHQREEKTGKPSTGVRVAVTTAVVFLLMSLLSTSHAASAAAFLGSGGEASTVARSRRRGVGGGGAADGRFFAPPSSTTSSSSSSSSFASPHHRPHPPTMSSLAYLMQSVAFRDGTVEVTRNVSPSGNNGKQGEGEVDEREKMASSSPGADEDPKSRRSASRHSTSGKEEKLSISYRIFRPMNLSSMKKAPLLVLHGGPGVPSDYLIPLVDHVPYRSIVFYDQIGCGRSSRPDDPDMYSIEYAVDDLEVVIKKLGLLRFHLYGQSFGGILAFEYLKRVNERTGGDDEDEDGCLSVILSGAPTSVREVEEEAQRLLDVLRDELAGDGGVDDDCDGASDESSAALGELFRLRHQCQTPTLPPPLANAYANAGKVWRGTTAIPDYVASPPSLSDDDDSTTVATKRRRMPSCLVMRGEHDFVTERCVVGWKSAFGHPYVRTRELPGCGHHALLEDGRTYGEVVDAFCSEYD